MKKKFKSQQTNKSTPIVEHVSESITLEESPLIVFDNKVKIFLISMFLLYILASCFKLHTSSVAMWDIVFGIKEPKSLIWGKPQGVRQDEWMVGTPVGLNIGNIKTDAGTKVNTDQPFSLSDLKLILYPQSWSAKVLSFGDVGRSFAFNWNFTIFFSIISSFLFFMLLTRNQFWLSLFGAFFIFSSSAVQWWSYSIAGLMILVNFIFISIAYLLYSKDKKAIIFWAWVLLVAANTFVTGHMYPAWQVPLVYILMAVLVGYILSSGIPKFQNSFKFKAIVAGITGAAFLFFLFQYYEQIKGTVEIMLNTAYPGKRVATGGDLKGGKLFSEFYGMYMNGATYPKNWLNICEVSSFIMFFPMVYYGIVMDYLKTKKIDWVLILLSGIVFVFLIWVVIGFPSFLSRISLMFFSPSYRTLPMLGLANCILLIAYLGRRSGETPEHFSWKEFGVLALVTFVFLKLVSANINTETQSFFTSRQVGIVTLLMTIVYLLIRYSNYKYMTLILSMILLGVNFNNLKIHPLTQGLSAVLDNPLVKVSADIEAKDRGARWAIYGNQMMSNLLKANGINLINGQKAIPPLDDMKILDPSGKDNFVYNRYAHINMVYQPGYEDGIYFQLHENETVNDNYSIVIHPCNPKLKQLGLKYVLFTYVPTPDEVKCMSMMSDMGSLFIYRRNDM
ncbi:MAG: hypothetical protein WBO36_01030 [Saprospiraceae bacterium]